MRKIAALCLSGLVIASCSVESKSGFTFGNTAGSGGTAGFVGGSAGRAGTDQLPGGRAGSGALGGRDESAGAPGDAGEAGASAGTGAEGGMNHAGASGSSAVGGRTSGGSAGTSSGGTAGASSGGTAGTSSGGVSGRPNAGASSGGAGAAGRGGAAGSSGSSGSGGGSACLPNPCVHGTCTVRTASPGYGCACTSGWLGVTCATADPCQAGMNPCQNGSACTAVAGSATCSCGPRFVGTRCEFQKFARLGLSGADPLSLSQDGSVAVGSMCTAPTTCKAARATTAQVVVTPLASPTNLPPGTSATSCRAYAVNGTGSWIGGECSTTAAGAVGTAAVEWLSGTTPSYVPGRTTGETVLFNDANLDGSVMVGCVRPPGGAAPQIMSRSSTNGISVLAPIVFGDSACASAVSNDGLVLVGISGGNPFRFSTGNGLQSLALYLGQSGSRVDGYHVSGISLDKTVIVGGYSAFPFTTSTALRWLNAGVQSLGSGSANAVNRDGSVIVGTSDIGACTWDTQGNIKALTDVIGVTADLNGWALGSPVAISDDGKVIVGSGTNGTQPDTWVVHLP